MTTSYLKLNLSQVEHYYYLFYLDKYHNQCLNILNDTEIITKPEYNISKNYLDNKISYELYCKIFKKDKLQQLKTHKQIKLVKKK
jgi:hypothetical protein